MANGFKFYLNTGRKLIVIEAFLLSLFFIFLGALAGNPDYYTFGSYLMIGVTVYLFLTKPQSMSLILLVIAIFLSLRYVPIIKFGQPLYVDPVHELATAAEFEKNGRVSILPTIRGYPNQFPEYQSGWPLIHLLAITIHEATGVPLFHVFTYFPPLVDLSSLFFIYLLTNYIFKSHKVGALSALIYATFYNNIFWTGTQFIRQNIAYSLALMAICLYVKGRTEKKSVMVALSLLTFGVIPIAHHLTPFELVYIFLFGLVFELFLSFGKKVHATIFHTRIIHPSKAHMVTPTLCFFLVTSTFLWWVSYASEIIFPFFAKRAFSVSISIIEFKLSGEFQEAVSLYGSPFSMASGIYDILSYVKVLLLALTTIFGIYILIKEHHRHRWFLFGSLLGPLLWFLIGWFVDRNFDMRHLLFLSIPAFLIAAKEMRKINNRFLAFCLLIILIPAPFKLFTQPGEPTPTFLYDRSSSQTIMLGRGVFYRDFTVLTASYRLTSFTEGNLTADSYTAAALLFNYDPYMVRAPYYLLKILSDPKLLAEEESVIIVDGRFFNEKYYVGFERGLSGWIDFEISIEELEQYANTLNSITNHIYDNGYVLGWKNPS